MELIILGTGGMMPMPDRFLASAALRHHGRGTLFDCGEGTQIPLKASGWGVGMFDRFVLTHRHADHVTGVPGMLMLLAQTGERRPLDILGLPEVCEYVRGTRRLLDFHMDYELHYFELDPGGGTVRGEDFTMTYRPLRHRTLNLGFRYEEHARPGRFNVERAEALGIPPGPARAALQNGRTVEVNGKTIEPGAVLGPPRRGRRFAYVVDTAPCDAILELLEGCDLAVIEGMFAERHADEAAVKMHLTARQAARFAAEAGVEKALLTHFSTRYGPEETTLLEAEAREVCDRVEAARALARYPIALPD
jgi:ribonuclease Z